VDTVKLTGSAYVFKLIDEDLGVGRLRHSEVDWHDSFRLAEQLSDSFTVATGAASVDVWHVAAARLLGADTFWTFDEEQRNLATRSAYFRRVPKLIP